MRTPSRCRRSAKRVTLAQADHPAGIAQTVNASNLTTMHALMERLTSVAKGLYLTKLLN